MKLSAGYRWLLEHYQPGIVLRVDADALILGHGLEAAAEKMFAREADIGLLGSYRVGPDGRQRDFKWPGRQLRAEVGLRGFLHPRRRRALRDYRSIARQHGYQDGEHALGGSYIHSYAAVRAIYEQGWFGDRRLETSSLGEDHLFSLVTMAAGFHLGDFSGPADPMALTWLGLPAHPAELLAAGKLVTHSVRSWQDLGEKQIRSIFAEARAATASGQELPPKPGPAALPHG